MDKAVQNNFWPGRRNALSITKFLNRRSVTKDVTNYMNACEDFLQLVIHAVSPDVYTAESPLEVSEATCDFSSKPSREIR